MKKTYAYHLVWSCLLRTSLLSAHVAFPMVVTSSTFYELFSWSLIALGLAVEWACFYYILRNGIRALYTIFLMNVVSTLVGSCILLFFRYVWSVPVLFGPHGVFAFTQGNMVLFFMGIIALNVALEYPVARYVLAHESKLVLFNTVLIANVLSALLSMVALGIYYCCV